VHPSLGVDCIFLWAVNMDPPVQCQIFQLCLPLRAIMYLCFFYMTGVKSTHSSLLLTSTLYVLEHHFIPLQAISVPHEGRLLYSVITCADP
jgi:hypothetical protein